MIHTAPPGLAIHRSRDLIPDFKLLRPKTATEVRAILDAEPDAVLLAGGLDLVNRMKTGVAPARVVMLDGVTSLHAIEEDPEATGIEAAGIVTIGALATHDAIATNAVLRCRLPDLAACWERIANSRIRLQGTLAGNLAADMPGYEALLLLAASAADIRHVEAGGRQATTPAAAFASTTAPAFPAFITAARITLPADGTARRLLYDRSLRPAVSVALGLDSREGCVTVARAVLGGCHGRPVVAPLPLAGLRLAALAGDATAIADAAWSGMAPPSIAWAGKAGYRERMASLLLARLLRDAAA